MVKQLAMVALLALSLVAATPGEHIRLTTQADVAALRTYLRTLIFGSAPPGQPTTVERNITDERFTSACSIDRITVVMEFGFKSTILHLHSCTPTGRLMIVHDGHNQESLTWQLPHVTQLLANGYDVALMWMPLYGENRQIVEVCSDGCLRVRIHDQMSFVRPTTGHPLRFYLEPVMVFLNYAAPGYDRIAMLGLSGGGWTTTWAAALDERIGESYPVAGSLPLYQRGAREWGDWEQWTESIYTHVTYSELNLLGAVGPGRMQLQVLLLDDSCCFRSGLATNADEVSGAAERMGGDWHMLVDNTRTLHQVSPWVMNYILGDETRSLYAPLVFASPLYVSP